MAAPVPEYSHPANLAIRLQSAGGDPVAIIVDYQRVSIVAVLGIKLKRFRNPLFSDEYLPAYRADDRFMALPVDYGN